MAVRTRNSRLVQIIVAALAAVSASMAATAANPDAAATTTGTVLEMQRDAPAASRSELDLPARGTTMQQVLARHGPPVEKHGPVGDPPIIRWDYPGYSLYFEYNLFLHAVVPSDPVPLVHEEQLAGRNR